MNIKKIGTFAIKLAVTIAVMVWIISTYGWARIVETVSHTQLSWLLAALGLFGISIILGAWQWAIILRNRVVAMRFPEVLRLYIIGMFLNNFVLGLVTGDIYRVASIHLEKSEGKKGLAATFLDRLAGLITLSGFAIIGGIFILRKNIGMQKELNAAIAALGLFTAIFFIILALISSTRLQTLCRRLLLLFKWIPGMARMQQLLEETFMNLHSTHDRLMFVNVAILSTLTQGMRIGVHMLCALALGIFAPSQIVYFFVIVPVIALMMIVPLPFGIKEAAASSLFSVAGFAYHEALVMEFLATIVGIAGSIPGAVVLLGNRRKRS